MSPSEQPSADNHLGNTQLQSYPAGWKEQVLRSPFRYPMLSLASLRSLTNPFSTTSLTDLQVSARVSARNHWEITL